MKGVNKKRILVKTIKIFLVLFICALVCIISISYYRNRCEHEKALKQGDRDADGHLVIYTWHFKTELNFGLFTLDFWEDHYGSLYHPYGIMIFYRIEKAKDRVEFEIYDQESGKISHATDLTTLKSILSTLPRGATIYLYNTCTAGTHYGLDSAIYEKMEEMIKEAGLFLEDSDYAFCTCRSV